MEFPFVIEDEFTPHIAHMIFHLLDWDTLVQCREVTKVWKNYIDIRTSFWSDISPQRFVYAAESGRLDICQLIIQYSENKNPRSDYYGETPLHSAASKGHMEICELIMENVSDKNPLRMDGFTPLHEAARNGHLEVCRLFTQNIADKNPASKSGWTPLHSAARNGYLEICRLILDAYVGNSNPSGMGGNTPLHEAAVHGHSEICQLIMDKVQDKNPTNHLNQTPQTFVEQSLIG